MMKKLESLCVTQENQKDKKENKIMNDVEKMKLEFQYIMEPDSAGKDVLECVDTIIKVAELTADKKTIMKMDPRDLIHFLVSMKEFNDEIKPIVIKYGILPHLWKGDK